MAERLTEPLIGGEYYAKHPIDIYDNEYSKANFQKIVNKLGKNEDLEEQCQKETTYSLSYLKDKWLEFMGDIAELLHYRELKAQGRLIELPCKVGDTVYCIAGKEILRGYVRRIRPFIGGDYINIMLDVGFTIVDPFYSDGRTTTFEQVSSFNPETYCTIVYHTREEAEAALKEREQE